MYQIFQIIMLYLSQHSWESSFYKVWYKKSWNLKKILVIKNKNKKTIVFAYAFLFMFIFFICLSPVSYTEDIA